MESETTQNTSQATTPPPPTSTSGDSGYEQKRKLIGVLSYLSLLVIVAYLMAKEDPKLLFHVKQGIVLAILEIGIMMLFQTIFMVFMPLVLVANVLLLVFSVIGIMNALKGRDKELPVIGHLATHIPL